LTGYNFSNLGHGLRT